MKAFRQAQAQLVFRAARTPVWLQCIACEEHGKDDGRKVGQDQIALGLCSQRILDFYCVMERCKGTTSDWFF